VDAGEDRLGGLVGGIGRGLFYFSISLPLHVQWHFSLYLQVAEVGGNIEAVAGRGFTLTGEELCSFLFALA
jgi:hypothetical protein